MAIGNAQRNKACHTLSICNTNPRCSVEFRQMQRVSRRELLRVSVEVNVGKRHPLDILPPLDMIRAPRSTAIYSRPCRPVYAEMLRFA